jgi:hypothetical protein
MPAHKLRLDAFFMDKYEVTNQEYARFAEAANKPKPWYWAGGRIAKGEEKLPVHDVTWFEADAYCKSLGKRLPTEAEWERAVRGGLDRKKFAWGDSAPGLGGNDPDAAPGAPSEKTKQAHVGFPFGAAPDPAKLVDQWFVRLNALDDWYISYDGKEESDAVVDKFLELYDSDAYHQVGPNENQIGPVVFHGIDGIRKWATDFARQHVALGYRVDFMTRNEKSEQPVLSERPAWGGIAAAVEFTAAYTTRQERKRIVVPGSAFFLFDEGGKIQRVRLYMLKDETAEIEQ